MPEVLGNNFFFDWEIHLMDAIQTAVGDSGILLSVLSSLSAFGEQLLLVAVMGFLYWGWNKEFGKYVGVNVLVACVWNPLIKNIAMRLRPYFASENIRLLRKIDTDADIMDVAAQGYSFPSGHSSSAVSLYGSLAAHEKKNRVFRVLAFLLPLLVGFSRVVVGAHYPTDVLCGWALGVIVVLFGTWLQRRYAKRWIAQLILLVLALPGIFYCRSSDYFTALGMMIGFFAACAFEERYVHFQNTQYKCELLYQMLLKSH